jgi:uncharacterized membrane protein
VTVRKSDLLKAEPGASLAAGLVFFGVCTLTSWLRWANFEYRTFDLAYYVQALWQLLHGRFEVSVEGVPLLGNHVEPIVFLAAPIFALARHPMTLVILQNALLASMAPVGFQVACLLGLNRKTALWMSVALLLAPAAGYIALHEFHPEALAAPFLLLLLRARAIGSLRAHWIWFLAILACKENLSLLLTAYCVVYLIVDRKRTWAELRNWYLWPLALSVLWFVTCTKGITPALNAGNIDYLALYDRLGNSGSDIAWKAITEPHRILAALSQSLTHGNLVWALLLPFLMLPLFSPRWLLVAAPVLLQHLLSWRSSEWTIYFHYAAPLLPLSWIALAESLAALDRRANVPLTLRRGLPLLVLAACVLGQIMVGPSGGIIATAQSWWNNGEDRVRRADFIRQIPPGASVVAPLPYLSHLAMREHLFSLHYILKGLKTLSRSRYDPPPPTEFVLIDYDDSATFDAGAGYYHPTMKTVDGSVVPSSERLLHDFLAGRSWRVNSSNELTLLRQTTPVPDSTPSSGTVEPLAANETAATLLACTKSADVLSAGGLEVRTSWRFRTPRDVFPWLFLKLTPRSPGKPVVLSCGLCSPESNGPFTAESWRITPSQRIAAGQYAVEALFVDNSKRLWLQRSGTSDQSALLTSSPVSLGELTVTTTESSMR